MPKQMIRMAGSLPWPMPNPAPALQQVGAAAIPTAAATTTILWLK